MINFKKPMCSWRISNDKSTDDIQCPVCPVCDDGKTIIWMRECHNFMQYKLPVCLVYIANIANDVTKTALIINFLVSTNVRQVGIPEEAAWFERTPTIAQPSEHFLCANSDITFAPNGWLFVLGDMACRPARIVKAFCERRISGSLLESWWLWDSSI